MGFLEVVTLVLVILKLTGAISISWFMALSPLIAAAVIYLIVTLLGGVSYFFMKKRIRK